MTYNLNGVNNLLPVNEQSFCELIAHCEIRELASRIGSAVASFFNCLIHGIYDLIKCKCCNQVTLAPPSIPTEQIVEEAPTPEVAQGRRDGAVAMLEYIKSNTLNWNCPAEILKFNLDTALLKYQTDQPPTKLLEWFDYAACDYNQREAIEGILNGFTGTDEKKTVVRHLVSKLHYILEEKRSRVDELSGNVKDGARTALKSEIENIFLKLQDAARGCIDQTLSQTEDIIIEVIASENPLAKNSTLALLQYRVAHALFRYRANLIKELLVKDPALEKAPHMADIEREVKKKVAEALGMEGAILATGAHYADMVSAQANAAAQQVADRFLGQYQPEQYLLGQCRAIWGDLKTIRNDLLLWATNYYGLGDDDDALSKEVVEDEHTLEEMSGCIAAVNLNTAGIQLFLQAAGIISQIA